MYAICGDQGLRLNVSLPIIFDEDNQTALDLCNPSKQWRSKNFIGIRWHIIRMEIQEGFALRKVVTTEIEADIWTKPLTAAAFIKIRDKLCHLAWAI